ncbi:hypothetical protein [Leptospira ilyithenensis]|uniref:CHASE2 domain-containing protein n=1 Tax=Leptospira ilyithenensis TaxID=2484901 RepID=A0A4R9LU65_9LEPT|nr:hypothetical protein [Leptospira ilyithenensis]TGN14343.1 hypothetical protein EHS11_02400 [Leptospira ilyithenensis]
MIKFFLFFLFLLLIGCNAINNLESKIKITNLKNDSKLITIIDVDGESLLHMKNQGFHSSLLNLLNILKEKKPKIIFIAYSFVDFDEKKSFFYEGLNSNFQTISTFILNNEQTIAGYNQSTKGFIGSKIKAIKKTNEEGYYHYSGIELPPLKIIKESKAICATYDYPNNLGEIDNIYAYHEFENCPLTITNELLYSDSLQIKFDDDQAQYALYSIKNDKPIRVIQHIGTETKYNFNYTPIQKKIYKKIKAKDLLEGNAKIEFSQIYIINSSQNKFKLLGGEEIYGSDLLGSKVFTFLDLASKISVF